MSWKQFGGINKLDNQNNIVVNTLTTDYLTVNNPYVGSFDICGNLVVQDNFVVLNNASISGNTSIGNDVDINGNLSIVGSVTALSNFNIQDINLAGNMVVGRSSQFIGNILSQNNIQVFNKIILDVSGDVFLRGNNNNVGINVTSPIATLDIYGNAVSSLNVLSNNIYTRNIIAQNNNKNGIAVAVDTSYSSISFYNDNSLNSGVTPGGLIQYRKGGTLVIDSSDNTIVESQLIVTERNNTSHIFNTTASIYDTSNGQFMYNTYRNNTNKTGTALSLVAEDNSSNTFLNITTPNKRGLLVCGGSYPVDQTRSMASFGHVDELGGYVPSQMIVSGNNAAKLQSTIGINTYAPRTDKYVLDINGPIHICNGDIKTTFFSNSEIVSLSKSTGFLNNFVAVGSPSTISSPYLQNAYRTINGGQSWVTQVIDNRSSNDTPIKLNPSTFQQAYSYDNSFSIIVNSKALNYYTINGGESWKILNLVPIYETYNTNAIYIDNSFVYIAGNIIAGNSSSIYIFENYYPASQSFDDINIQETQLLTLSNGLQNQYIYSMFGNGNYLYVSVPGYLLTYNKSVTSVSSNTKPSLLYTTSDISYNSIHAVNGNIAVAVGYQKINYTKNNGETWTPVNSSSFNTLNSVFIIDTKNAIAVGSNATIVYSNNGFTTWNTIPYDILNAAGNANELLDPSNTFTNVTMTDINTVVISATTTQYVSTTAPKIAGKSKLYYLYVPSLFNNHNNTVFDLCGNMNIDGNVVINKKITVNDTIMTGNYESTTGNINIGTSATNKNINIGGIFPITGIRNVITIGGPYDTINIGGNISQTGDTPSYLGNAVVNGYLSVASNGAINSTVDSTSVSTGALVVAGGVGIGANVFIGKNLSVNNQIITQTATDATSLGTGSILLTNGGGISVGGNAFIGKSTFITGNVTINSNSESTSTTSGALLVSGGIGISGNIQLGGNAIVSKHIIVNGNTVSNALGTGTLVVNGGTSVTGNVYIGENASIVGNISTTKSVFVSGTTESNSTTTGTVTVGGGIGIAGNAFVGGNVRVLSARDSTSNTTGAITVGGGIGIVGNAFVGGNAVVTRNVIVSGTTESTSTTTGAITVAGGIGIVGNTFIGGNSTITRNVSILSTTDSLEIGSGALRINGGVSIGTTLRTSGNIITSGIIETTSLIDPSNIGVGALVLAGGASITGNIFGGKNISSTGTLRTNALTNTSSLGTGALIVASGGTSLGGNTYIGGNLVTTNVNASAIFGSPIISTINTASINTSTGALRLSGGIGVAGNAYIGGNVNVTNELQVSGTTPSTDNTNGALRVAGGVGIQGNLYVRDYTQLGGNVVFARNTESTNINTGAAIIYGGVGIQGNTNIGGNLSVLKTTASTSSTTGAITTTGGLGVGGNVNIGGSISFAGGLVGPVTINEATGSIGNAIVGSLIIKHDNINGASSIIFPSKYNYGSDFGYIRFEDNSKVVSSSGETESALLTIGIENDNIAGSNLDRINFAVGVVGMSNSTPNNAYKLDVNGSVNATSYNASSDYRIKKNVNDIELTEYNIDKLRPVHYDNSSTGKHDIGFIAHELQEHFPFLVNGEKDGEYTQSINYIGLIGVLVKEVQVLKEEIAKLTQNK